MPKTMQDKPARWTDRRDSDATVVASGNKRGQLRMASLWLLWLIAILFAVLFAWAAISEIDTVTRADGRVIPSAKLQVIQNLEGGIVAEILAKPGQLVFASSGGGSTSHLAAELLKNSVGGMDTIHVPYKGVAPALVDLIAGNTQALVSTMPSATPHVKSDRLRALAVASLKRAETFPELPTFDESGFPGFEASAWNAVLAPVGTPRDIINSLHAVIVRSVKTADARERFLAQGAEPVGDSPDQFGVYLRAEVAKWAKVIKVSGSKLD